MRCRTHADTDIVSVCKDGIQFKDGTRIEFESCVIACSPHRYRYIGDRDITGVPPYFEFFTKGMPTRIVFPYRGILGKRNRKHKKAFYQLQKQLREFGYSTRDLS